MTSTESTEPKGSDDSSTNPRCGNGECGHLRSSHFNRDKDTAYCIGSGDPCPCDGFYLPVEQIHKWKRCTECPHQEHSQRCMSMLEETGDNCRCLQLTPAREIEARCRGAGGCPEHPTERQRDSCPHCGSEEHKWAQCALYEQAVKADEPPLAPEEGEPCGTCPRADNIHAKCPCDEEDEDADVEPWPCGDCGARVPGGLDWCPEPDCQAKAREALAPPPPPQPLRRPPYAVAYSVAGHLYEIALPGDATVQATDGGLIITHTLGPVAGVVRVHPIEGEQS